MRKTVHRFTDITYRALASNKFFVVVLGLFIVQAVWLSFTAIYPMPFDEYTHVGAIQLYAKQWSWVIANQPIDTGILGELTREPSFLYRWLMSFPYRGLSAVLSVEQAIIAMRIMNVAMVGGGILLFRKLLQNWRMSTRIIHIVLLAFVMTPIVPFLAAHVNYDNMMFLLTPVALLYATRLIRGNDRLVTNVAMFMLSGLAATLAKQTFLPIFMILAVYVGVVIVRRNGSHIFDVLRQSWRGQDKNWRFYLILTTLALLTIMATERYVGNMIMYGSYRPACEIVQPVELCEDFGPWYRNKIINAQNRPDSPPYGNPLSYSQYWTTRMMRGYFALFQHTPTEVVSDKEPYGPIVARPLLPVQVNFAAAVAVAGVLAVIWKRRNIWHDPYLRFALVVTVGFIMSQWIYNYSSYLNMWKAEAIQARYTYPIMILIFTLIVWAINKIIVSRQLKALLVVAMFIFYVWGGGTAGWLIRADNTWRWQHSAVQQVNHQLQNILRFTVFH